MAAEGTHGVSKIAITGQSGGSCKRVIEQTACDGCPEPVAVSGSQGNGLHQTATGKGQGDRLGPSMGKQEEGRARMSPHAPSALL